MNKHKNSLLNRELVIARKEVGGDGWRGLRGIISSYEISHRHEDYNIKNIVNIKP